MFKGLKNQSHARSTDGSITGKAIVTKYHGPTNSRGSRISAEAEGVGKIYLSYDHALDADENHIAAATTLANKYGWLTGGTKLYGGGIPGQRGYAFVMVR